MYMKYKLIICTYCNREISSNAFTMHTQACKSIKPIKKKWESWNKGLTKESHASILKASNTLKENYKTGKIIHKKANFTIEQKIDLSNKLKKAHAEGRHPGWAHVNDDPNKRSYAERWFATSITNDNFLSTCSIIEQFPEGKYRIDFAFVDQRVAVEIDGCQHELPEIRNKDLIRDAYLQSKGWSIYRIAWTLIHNNPKQCLNDLCNYLKSTNKNSYVILANKSKIQIHKSKLELKILSENKAKDDLQKLIDNKIDFSAWGWRTKAALLLNKPPQKMSGWIKRFHPDLKCR